MRRGNGWLMFASLAGNGFQAWQYGNLSLRFRALESENVMLQAEKAELQGQVQSLSQQAREFERQMNALRVENEQLRRNHPSLSGKK